MLNDVVMWPKWVYRHLQEVAKNVFSWEKPFIDFLILCWQKYFTLILKMTILINFIGKFCYWCWNVQNTEAATGCVLKNFRKFAGKRLYQYLFVNKVAGLRPVKYEILYIIAAGHSYLIESCSENVWEISRSMSAWLQLSFEPLWFFQIYIFSGEGETLFFFRF